MLFISVSCLEKEIVTQNNHVWRKFKLNRTLIEKKTSIYDLTKKSHPIARSNKHEFVF